MVERKKKKQQIIIGQSVKSRVLVILLVIGFIVTLPVAFYFLQYNLFQERSANAELLMSQVARNIDSSMQNQWAMVEHFSDTFLEGQPSDMEEALYELEKINQTTNDTILKLYLIDTDSYCYQSDGTRFRWTNTEMLNSEKPRCQISTAEFLRDEESVSMFFINPLEEKITLDGKTFSHLGVAVTMEFIDSFFKIDYFEGNTIAYILRSNGSQVYKQQSEDLYNLLVALEKAEYQWGSSHEQLTKAIESKETGCISLKYEGESYYLIHAPLSANDWVSVMLVPEDSIATGARGFMFSIIIIVVILAIFALGILLTIVISINSSTRRQLEQAAEAERKANRAKTQFLSAMSHDIRTPMNAIVGMTNLALDHTEEPQYIENSLKKVKMASNHLLTLINDVLDISKVESGKMVLNPVRFSLKEEIENLRNVFQPQADEKEQVFVCNMTENVLGKNIYADRLRISQIMYNLVANAIKYTPAHGRIEVVSSIEDINNSKDKIKFIFQVSDTGIGMSDEFQKEMYSTFTRENNEPQGSVQGTGLGLAICKQMIDIMGGTIECESNIGTGTRFIVSVELDLAKEQEANGTDIEDVYTKCSMEDLSEMRILVAEDNDFNWEIDKEIMEMYGMIPVRAENGFECVQMVEQSDEYYYGMILMDIQMPVMDGYEATKRIRSSEREYLKAIPIVAMTANAFAEDIQQCREAGMNAHLAKPFEISRLLEIIMNYRVKN